MVNKIEKNVLSRGISRRGLLKAGAGFGAAVAFTSDIGWAAAQDDQWTLALSLRSMSNSYDPIFAAGGEAFAKYSGLPFEILISDGSSQKAISDVSTLLQKTKGKLILNIDPNDSPDAHVIVDLVSKAGGYVVTQWNKPDDLHPWDHNPNYVAHISFDGVPAGEEISKVLFEAMGGEGGVVGLGGILSNIPAVERKLGFTQAIEKTGGKIKLLDFQAADWNEQKAFEITQAWLTRFSGEIKGIFAASDGMAIGALEALRQTGLAGQIPIVGMDGTDAALAAVEAGEVVGTIDWDRKWMGGIGLALGHAVATGKVDIASEPKEHREFYGSTALITKDTLGEFNTRSTDIDFEKLWSKATGQIEYRG